MPIHVAIGVAVVLGLTFYSAGWALGIGAIASYAIFVLVTNFPREVRGASSYIAVFVWVSLVTVLKDHEVGENFYVVAAQVLPVLVLASAISSRFSLLGTEEPERRVRVILLYAIGAGEVYSLIALADGSPPGSGFPIVAAGLSVAGILLFAELFAVAEPSENDENS